jgi:hypothetical protein
VAGPVVVSLPSPPVELSPPLTTGHEDVDGDHDRVLKKPRKPKKTTGATP